MTVTSHATTGALIAVAIQRPLLAIPLAFGSHFLLDVLPHFGYDRCGYGPYFKHRLAWFVLLLDILAFSTILILSWPQPWLVYLCAAIAVSPDFAWPYRYYFFEKRGRAKPGEGSKFNQWHSRIQWCERPWGILFEIAWVILVLTLITNFL